MPRRRHVCHVCHAGLGCRADFILASRAVRPRAAALRHADGVGAFSSGGPIGQIRLGVGCHLPIRCLSRSLRSIRVSRAGSDPPPGTGPGQHGPRPGRVRVIRVTLSGSRLPRTLGRAGTSHPRPEGPVRPGASESQDSVGKAAARGAAGGVPAAPTASGATPRLSGPAGRPEHHRGWVCGRKIELMATGRGVRSSPR